MGKETAKKELAVLYEDIVENDKHRRIAEERILYLMRSLNLEPSYDSELGLKNFNKLLTAIESEVSERQRLERLVVDALVNQDWKTLIENYGKACLSDERLEKLKREIEKRKFAAGR